MNIIREIELLAGKWLNEADNHGVDAHVYRDLGYQVIKLIAKHKEAERIEQMYRSDVDYTRHSPW